MRRPTPSLTVPFCIALALTAGGAFAGAQQTPEQQPPPVQAPPRLPAPTQPEPPKPSPQPEPRRFEPYVSVSSVFDTNIDHNRDDTDSLGGLLGLGLRYRNNVEDRAVEITGEVAGHSYTNSSRWDRFSQKLIATYDHDLPGRWSFDTTGEISLKGSSEDRELSDQYVLEPRLGFRISPQTRVRVYGAVRARRYDDNVDRNAFNRYVGVEFTERPAENRRWDVGLRYEVNETRGPRNHYVRWTLGTGYSFVVPADNRLDVEVRYRMQRYPFRTIEVEEDDVPRRDHRWIPRITWTRPLGGRLDLRGVYTYETRTSNDPDREFAAHLFSLGVVRRW